MCIYNIIQHLFSLLSCMSEIGRTKQEGPYSRLPAHRAVSGGVRESAGKAEKRRGRGIVGGVGLGGGRRSDDDNNAAAAVLGPSPPFLPLFLTFSNTTPCSQQTRQARHTPARHAQSAYRRGPDLPRSHADPAGTPTSTSRAPSTHRCTWSMFRSTRDVLA